MIFLFVYFFFFFYCFIYKNFKVVYWLSFFYTVFFFPLFFSYKLFSFKNLVLQGDVLGLVPLVLYKNLNHYCSKFEVLLWLTSFIMFSCLIYLYNVCGFSLAKHCFLLLVIEILLLCCFLVKILLSFFICFEFLLILMVCLIDLDFRGRKRACYFF